MVLLLPGAVIGPLVGACCGVDTTNFTATAPAEACVGDKVTIASDWDAAGDPGIWFKTGVYVKIWDPGGALIKNEVIAVTTGELMESDGYMGPYSKDYDFVVSTTGEYDWQITFYVEFSDGLKMDSNVVGGSIAVETCFSVDVKPGSCPNAFNRGEKGVLPVAIMGDDIASLDPMKVKLNGVAPLRWSIEDAAIPDNKDNPVGCNDCLEYSSTSLDGVKDLLLKYDAEAVAATLAGAAKGQCVVVNVTLADGTNLTDVLKITK